MGGRIVAGGLAIAGSAEVPRAARSRRGLTPVAPAVRLLAGLGHEIVGTRNLMGLDRALEKARSPSKSKMEQMATLGTQTE
jgi:hypothetical protein